jgi:hypothetical protein
MSGEGALRQTWHVSGFGASRELGIEKQMAARQERPSACEKIGGKADFVNEAKPRAPPLKRHVQD